MGHRTSRRRRGNDADAADADSERGRSPAGERRPADTDRVAERRVAPEPGLAVDRSETTDDGGAEPGRVAYDPGPEAGTLGNRYGLEVGRREAGRFQRLESEFGSERVQRWAEEGMPVEAMGKPRDMQAFRERESEGPGAASGSMAGVQAKLEVSSPDDPAERQAERVAEAIVSPEASGADQEASRRPAAVAPAPGGSTGGGAVRADAEATVREGVRGSGTSLPAGTRRTFESKLGADLSNVSVHTGQEADEAARSINAEAFTIGSDIAFARGNYQPGTRRGTELLAHELTHVVQQDAAPERRARSAGRVPARGSAASADVHRAVPKDGKPYAPSNKEAQERAAEEERSSKDSSSDEQQQQDQEPEKVSPNDLSERTQRVLLSAGYGGVGKIPKPIVETARDVAELKRELGNDDDVAFFVVCNALVASAYPTKTAANEWQIKFEGAVDDARDYSSALSVSKDMVRAVLEEVVDAPTSPSVAIDAYNGLHRSPRLKTVNEVKTGGPAGEEEREIVENWENDVLNYVLLDTKEKKLTYNAGKQKMRTKDKERTNKMLELANALREAGLGGVPRESASQAR